MSFYIDLSEFLTNPIKTGIQRISGEMCRYLHPGQAIPIRVHSDRFVALPAELIQAIGAHFSDSHGSAVADIRRLGSVDNGMPLTLTREDTVLVPEVFDNPQRLALYRAMNAEQFGRCRFLIYDLLPLTHPEFFDSNGLPYVYSYFHLVRGATNCGYISDYTCDTYNFRFKRSHSREGVVLPLGSDSLGPRAKTPLTNRPLTFTVLGTIEPRKNHQLVLEAFEPLLGQVPGLVLNFIGRMGWAEPSFARRVEALASDPSSGLRFFSAPDDGAIRRYIEESRATIYVSAAEGFGLPPVESLWVGTPVIASSTIPSLHRLGSDGIHYVEPLNAFNLRRAILAFTDDHYANRKIKEALQLALPTWRSFTEELLYWCSC